MALGKSAQVTYASGRGNFNSNRYHTGKDAAVEGGQKADGFIVCIDQSYTITWFQTLLTSRAEFVK